MLVGVIVITLFSRTLKIRRIPCARPAGL
jgi:hypothetical protein